MPASAGHPSAIEINRYLTGEGITNRRLLGRKVGWDWNEKFRILADFKEKMENEIFKLAPKGRDQNLKILESCLYSKLLNEARTHFQEKSKDFFKCQAEISQGRGGNPTGKK